MQERRLPWELLGAVVGAGLASGREIASFFSRYGMWSIAGIGIAVTAMAWLSQANMPACWHGRWQERLWHILLSLLLTATGGAMLAGAGEVAALTLPFHGAYAFGMAATLLLAWLLAKKTASGLSWVSRLLLCVLAVLIGTGLLLPPMQAAALAEVNAPEALLRALTYGGFNAALQMPIMRQADALTARSRKRSTLIACMLLTCLLLLGNAVLLRHPALLGEAMPFVRLTAQLGQIGYLLGAVSLYLAILSTLTACLRGLSGNLLSLAGLLAAALVGLMGVVDVVYPVLGGACALMLLLMRFHARS